MDGRYCIVGAGYSGLAAAKAFADLGIAYDHIEATERLGGNWSHGVYDSTHLISSRKTTQYADFPMPDDYPDFPSAAQMLGYLQNFAAHFGIDGTIEYGKTVARVQPLDSRGKAGWQVDFSDGESRKYSGVVVANGHYWAPFTPAHPGTFSGKQIHSKAYRNPADFEGTRVLVVGGGNSACDLAVEAAISRGTADLSLRRGYWFLPKYVFGRPTSEYDIFSFPVPKALEIAVYRLLIRVGFGGFEDYGLPKPCHGILDQDVVVNSQLPYFLKHGRIRPRPGIDRFEGSTVHFVDGTSGEYDTIVWATGFTTKFPFLPDGMLAWENGQPKLLDHLVPPGFANIYLYGLVAPRSGAGALLSNSARLMAEMVTLQQDLPVPIGDLMETVFSPSAAIRAGGPELRWLLSRTTPLLALLKLASGLVPGGSKGMS